MKTTFWLSLLAAGLAMAFAVQNSQMVQIKFFTWSLQGNQALVLFLTFSLGVAAGFLAAFPWMLRRKKDGPAKPADPPKAD